MALPCLATISPASKRQVRVNEEMNVENQRNEEKEPHCSGRMATKVDLIEGLTLTWGLCVKILAVKDRPALA